MSKLIYVAEGGWSIELDISSSMRRAIHDNDPDALDKEFHEMKTLIVKNVKGFHQPYKFQMPKMPKFIRRFF